GRAILPGLTYSRGHPASSHPALSVHPAGRRFLRRAPEMIPSGPCATPKPSARSSTGSGPPPPGARIATGSTTSACTGWRPPSGLRTGCASRFSQRVRTGRRQRSGRRTWPRTSGSSRSSGVSGSPPADLLASLATAFATRGWRWYVFGAQAVVAHGRPRLTADVDASVDIAGAAPGELVEALERHGFTLRFPLSPEHLREARLLPLVHDSTGMPLDLTLAAPGFDQDLLERARPFDFGGVLVPVVSAEDLCAMKILAGRRKDIEDVRGVLVQQGDRLDLDRIRELLAAIEAASGEPVLLPRLERLIRATRGKRRGR